MKSSEKGINANIKKMRKEELKNKKKNKIIEKGKTEKKVYKEIDFEVLPINIDDIVAKYENSNRKTNKIDIDALIKKIDASITRLEKEELESQKKEKNIDYAGLIKKIDDNIARLEKEELESQKHIEREKPVDFAAMIKEIDEKIAKIELEIKKIELKSKADIKSIAKSIFSKLGEDYNDFNISKIDDVNASLVMPNLKSYRGATVIIGDDGSYLVCGTRYPVTFYIEEFKNGRRSKPIEKSENERTSVDVLSEKYYYKLGMELTKDLENKLLADGYVQRDVSEFILYSNDSIYLYFFPDGKDHKIRLVRIALSSDNMVDSVLGIKNGEKYFKTKHILLKAGFREVKTDKFEKDDIVIYLYYVDSKLCMIDVAKK